MADADVHNYSSSSPSPRKIHFILIQHGHWVLISEDRLPTLSASQALQNLSSTPARPISTGLPVLDAYLQGIEASGSQDGPGTGGVTRGEVTEVNASPQCPRASLKSELH